MPARTIQGLFIPGSSHANPMPTRTIQGLFIPGSSHANPMPTRTIQGLFITSRKEKIIMNIQPAVGIIAIIMGIGLLIALLKSIGWTIANQETSKEESMKQQIQSSLQYILSWLWVKRLLYWAII